MHNDNNILIEIYSEEIPAQLINKIQLIAGDVVKSVVNNYNLPNNCVIKSFVSARRIVVSIGNIPNDIKTNEIKTKGPKISSHENAIDGFLKKFNILKSDSRLCIYDDYYYFHQKESFINIDIILDAIMQDIICHISKKMPVKMDWHSSVSIPWIRPIRNILCIFNDKIIDFEYCGIKSTNFTFGNRNLAEMKQIFPKSRDDYFSQMRNQYVILDNNERMDFLFNQIDNYEKEFNIKISSNNNLLNEICGIFEYPELFISEIPEKFLSLPKCIIQNFLEKNQKYIIFNDKNENISQYIGICLEVFDKDKTLALNGHSKVINARLNDALFLYEKDKSVSIAERKEMLKKIEFHKDFGSIEKRIETMNKIAVNLSSSTILLQNDNLKNLYQAIEYSKLDLTTNIVQEFPELQGIIGCHYAKDFWNLSEEVAAYIKDQYKLSFDEKCDFLPALFSVMEKIDYISNLWSCGVKATSSSDPFGFKQKAIAIINILIKFEINIDIYYFLHHNEGVILKEVFQFIAKRFEVFLCEKLDDFNANDFTDELSDGYIFNHIFINGHRNIGHFYQEFLHFKNWQKTNGEAVSQLLKRLKGFLMSDWCHEYNNIDSINNNDYIYKFDNYKISSTDLMNAFSGSGVENARTQINFIDAINSFLDNNILINRDDREDIIKQLYSIDAKIRKAIFKSLFEFQK